MITTQIGGIWNFIFQKLLHLFTKLFFLFFATETYIVIYWLHIQLIKIYKSLSLP